jgi:alpha-galactosidase/6-phospho-beta-glucosidase family protein
VVVEWCASIERWGVHAEFPGPLPHGPAEAYNSHLAEQELTVDAAIHGDRRRTLQTLLMEPAVKSWETAAYLPRFR